MPLTQAQAAELRNLAGTHLEGDELVLAVADASLPTRGWYWPLFAGFMLAAFAGWALVGQLVGMGVEIRLLSFPVVGSLLGAAILMPILPRWKLLVTNRRFLALRKHPLIAGRLTGAASSYRRDYLDRIEFASKSSGGVLTLVASATGGKGARYSLLSCKPTVREFEEALGHTGPKQSSD